MIGSFSLHRVKDIVLEDARNCEHAYSRHLMIRLDDGTEIEMILFGDARENLEIKSGTYQSFIHDGIQAKIV